MLRGIIKATLYVRVSRNQFSVRHIESGRATQVTSDSPFTTHRLLIGNFSAAEVALRRAFAEVHSGPKYFAAPRVLMHPVEMVEGGLSDIENRVLLEVADCAGAGRMAVWVGNELSDSEVLEKVSAS